MQLTVLTNLLALCAFAVPSFARVDGISAPATVPANQTFQVTLTTQEFITNWEDFSIVFGMASATGNQCGDTCVGSAIPLTFSDLVLQGWNNTGHGNFTETITAPATTGAYNITAAITSAFGASEEVAVRFFSTNITVQ